MERTGQPGAGAAELHLELSSEDRLRIVAALQKENLKLTDLEKHLDLTGTEALRQLHRLTDARLVERMPDGKYQLTAYARLVLDAAAPLEFIARYREFFLEHDGFVLPVEFRARLGELSKCKLIPSTVETINEVTQLIQGTQERLDTVIMGTEAIIELMRQRSQAGVKVRWLMHESFRDRAPAVLRAWERLPEVRSTPTVPGHIVVSERAALLTVRTVAGEMAYASFVGEDTAFRQWASDLFAHEWQKARPWAPL